MLLGGYFSSLIDRSKKALALLLCYIKTSTWIIAQVNYVFTNYYLQIIKVTVS